MKRRAVLLTTVVAIVALLFGSLPLHAAQGFYSVSEIDGVAWFIDPEGQPFFSLGVSDIGPGAPREKYDAQKPAYAAFRYYESTQAWADDTTKRLKDWNFNTLGSWVHPSLTHATLPYAEVLHFGAYAGVPWNDMFHEDFASQVDKLAKAKVSPRAGDRNLLGWYTDNELSWYPDTLFNFHLSRPRTSATRAKLLELLGKYYQQDFAALSRDFEVTGATGFDDMDGVKLKLRLDGNGRAAIDQFAAAVAEQYYRVVHDAIRRYDANHLILGDRYAWFCPMVVAKSAKPYVDVISTNFDWPEATDGYLPRGYLRNLHAWTGRPVLVSEYYTAANENRSGNKNTGQIFLTVDGQQARATAARARLRCLAELPYIVGSHWFRFADEPTFGRSDGEDYNFGLVDIDNRPYKELVSAMTELNAEVPRLHKASNKLGDLAGKPICIPNVSLQTEELHERLLSTQSLGSFHESPGVYDMAAAWNSEVFHLAVMVCHASEQEMYSSEFLDDNAFELTINSTELESPVQIRFGGTNGAQSDKGSVKCWISASGLRHTLVVPISAKLLGKTRLSGNDRINLQFRIRGLRDGTEVEWQNSCVLVADEAAASRPEELNRKGS